MRVNLAGASGAVGIPITGQLISAGHLVVDARDRDALLRALDGLETDAVIHQLTALKNASPRLRADDPTGALRTRGTANLLDAARLVGARRFLTHRDGIRRMTSVSIGGI